MIAVKNVCMKRLILLSTFCLCLLPGLVLSQLKVSSQMVSQNNDDFPLASSMVLLRSSIGFYCTGHIVSKHFVLTQAHCLTDMDGHSSVEKKDFNTSTEVLVYQKPHAYFKSGFSLDDLKKQVHQKVIIPKKHIFIHPFFRSTKNKVYENDLAILYHKDGFLMDQVKQVKIYSKSRNEFSKHINKIKISMMGYKPYLEEKNEKTFVKLMNHDLKNPSFLLNSNILFTGFMVFAYENDFLSSHGYSGSPLYSIDDEGHPIIYGLFQSTNEVDHKFIMPAYYKHWIEDVVQSVNQDPEKILWY